MTARRRLLLGILAAAAIACVAQEGRGDLFGRTLSDAQQAIADTRINHGDMTIVGATDRADTTYSPGQPIALSVKVSKDAHVAILRVLANGATTIVFPNKSHPNADVKANTVLTVPGPGDTVKLAAGKPGIELYEFLASTAGDSWLFTRPPDKDSDFAYLGVTTRAIAKDLVSTLKVGKGPDTAAIYVTVRVSGGGLL